MQIAAGFSDMRADVRGHFFSRIGIQGLASREMRGLHSGHGRAVLGRDDIAKAIRALTPVDWIRLNKVAVFYSSGRPIGPKDLLQEAFARAMAVVPPFPPTGPDVRYVYQVRDATAAGTFLRSQWRSVYHEALGAAGLSGDDLSHWFFHQTHGAQVDDLLHDLGVPPSRTVRTVGHYGNMGTPTFAVAMAQAFADIRPGDRYLLQAVGGGVSWGAIVAEHR